MKEGLIGLFDIIKRRPDDQQAEPIQSELPEGYVPFTHDVAPLGGWEASKLDPDDFYLLEACRGRNGVRFPLVDDSGRDLSPAVQVMHRESERTFFLVCESDEPCSPQMINRSAITDRLSDCDPIYSASREIQALYLSARAEAYARAYVAFYLEGPRFFGKRINLDQLVPPAQAEEPDDLREARRAWDQFQSDHSFCPMGKRWFHQNVRHSVALYLTKYGLGTELGLFTPNLNEPSASADPDLEVSYGDLGPLKSLIRIEHMHRTGRTPIDMGPRQYAEELFEKHRDLLWFPRERGFDDFERYFEWGKFDIEELQECRHRLRNALIDDTRFHSNMVMWHQRWERDPTRIDAEWQEAIVSRIEASATQYLAEVGPLDADWATFDPDVLAPQSGHTPQPLGGRRERPERLLFSELKEIVTDYREALAEALEREAEALEEAKAAHSAELERFARERKQREEEARKGGTSSFTPPRLNRFELIQRWSQRYVKDNEESLAELSAEEREKWESRLRDRINYALANKKPPGEIELPPFGEDDPQERSQSHHDGHGVARRASHGNSASGVERAPESPPPGTIGMREIPGLYWHFDGEGGIKPGLPL